MGLQKNEEYIVDIIDNGFEGEGIAKIDGFTIFVPNAIKGEKIKILIIKVNKNFAYGKILDILITSESRVIEDCKTYKRCGGCNLRHIKYEDTLKMKKVIVENCLYKALNNNINYLDNVKTKDLATGNKENFNKANFKFKVNDVIGMENPFHYRNKLIYPVGVNKNNKTIMGVFANRTHDIVEVEECMLQDKMNQEIANTVLQIIINNKIAPYNEDTNKGFIRHVIIRNGKSSNEVMVILVCNVLKCDNNIKNFEENLVQTLTNKYSEIKSIVKNVNNEKTNVIMGDKNIVLYGAGYIIDYLDEYVFKISPHSFYQVNPVQTVKLYNIAIKYANLNKEDTVLDLYCGIGTISIFLAKYVKKVIGIEIIEEAVKDAKENAKLNNINNIDFYVGNVEKVLPEVLENLEDRPRVVFVDPPRKGLDNNTIKTIMNVLPSKIVYISCNPATLARDVDLLSDKYILKELQPVDMFCFTAHVECVAILQLKDSIQ